jgi:multimeric flavodoxin WrbA
MNILILNGSPKGDNSVTLQYVNYLAKKNPQHTFTALHVAQRIRRIEHDAATFEEVIAQVGQADAVIWSFPLYYMLVHAHYKRFIELIFERGVQAVFAGKYAAAISTSIHFFDHTAHNYIHAICDDLQMRFVESFSADMTDIFRVECQKQLVDFGKRFLAAVETGAPTYRQYAPILSHPFDYQPGAVESTFDLRGKKLSIVYDGEVGQETVRRMVERMRAALSGDVQVVNLREVDIKSSCLGCIHCGIDNECAFEGKDGYIEFYRSTIMNADLLIYVGAIHDRYLSARWKTFFDRSFFNTHTPVLRGKHMAFVLSGPLSQQENLREVLQGYTEVQGTQLTGVLSDEVDTSATLDALLDRLLGQMITAALENSTVPATFLGVGGLKVFRDDVWGRLRAVFQADHRAYQRLGIYQTFPQRDWRTGLLNTFGAPLLRIPRFKRWFQKNMIQNMVMPAKQLVNKMRV